MDKVFLGARTAQLRPGKDAIPITRVELLDENGDILAEAGTDEGRTLSSVHPDGTAEMARSILSKVDGYVYRPYEADDALLDPAAELGDGVTVGGIYATILSEDADFADLFTADLAAPMPDELDEYPYVPAILRQVQRNYQRTNSRITKTAEQIRLEVAGLEDTISVTLDLVDGLTIKDADGTVKIKGGMVDAKDLHVNSANIDGTLRADQIEMTGSITWPDLAADAQNQITSAQNEAISAYNLANSANTAAGQANAIVSGWTYPGTTQINGNMIMTNTVMASKLLGGVVALLDQSQNQVGVINIGATSTGPGVEFTANNGGMRFNAAGNIWFSGYPYSFGTTASGLHVAAPLFPGGDAQYPLGLSNFRWNTVYAASGTIVTSDRDAKHDIDYDMSRYAALFDRLRPVSFRYDDGTSGRSHVGYIAQDVEEAMTEAGLTSLDFAGFVKSPRLGEDGEPIEGKYDYALRYAEFVPLNTWMIQQLAARVARLERSFAS